MAAGEQQPQPVVAVVAGRSETAVASSSRTASASFGARRASRRNRSSALLRATVVSHAAGLVGHAVASPDFGGHDDRVLQRVLGAVDVAGQPDEGGQHLATLDPDDLVERVDQVPSLKSMTGRTSTLPCQAPGICAAQCSASSRSLQSSR